MFIQERYEIIGKIGVGGMADVYKAKDHKLNRFVAVKVLKSEFRADKAFVSKFRVEAQSAAGLTHSNIVNVYDVGEEADINFIVMELVEGITLKEYIEKKGHLAVREATSIAIQISMGLQAAHQHKIVHRDVKPQNIIISTDGKVKVTDFGIARATTSNTISSNVMGSVHYSSPEQARGGYSDSKGDIYSLGITMYEMLTGHVPYDGDTAVAIAIKHLQEEMQSPRKYVADLPKSTVQIIYKCTQKSPDRRYMDVEELVRDLKESLVNPEGDFVQILPLNNHAQTVVLSDEEVEQIKNGGIIGEQGNYHQQYQGGNQEPYGNDNQRDTYGAGYPGEYENEYYPEIDDEDDRTGKREKILTAASIIIGIAIVLIVLLVVGNAVGLIDLGFLTGDSNRQTEATTESATGTEADDTDMIAVPDLRGMTGEEATDILNGMGLGGRFGGEVESSEYPAGQIVEHEPAARQEVAPNTTIVFYLSKGEESVFVPNVEGKDLTEAQSMFQEYNLKINTEYAHSDSVEEDLIISTNPSVGSSVSRGDTITVTISRGPQIGNSDTTDIVSMPSIVGDSLEAARARVEALGLYLNASEDYSSEYAAGIITEQSIGTGVQVSKGTTIDVVVSIGPLEDEDPNPDEQGVAGEATYSCNVNLKQPEGYAGEEIRITLEQDGVETTILEGQTVQFPYNLRRSSNSNSNGVAFVYITQVDGTIMTVRYAEIPFE